MLGKKIIFVLLFFVGMQSLSAQDEIYTHDGEVLQVVLLSLTDDVLFYRESDDRSRKVYEIHLSAIKDFKLFVNEDNDSKLDPAILLERFRAVNKSALENGTTDLDESERVDKIILNKGENSDKELDINLTDNIVDNKKSVLEQNYLSWEWEERGKRVDKIVEKLEANNAQIISLRAKKRALQINMISLYSKALNIKYKQRALRRCFLEGSIYGFNSSDPRRGGSGFAVDAGVRYMFLDMDTDIDKYYRKNLGVGIAAIVGFF